jgi:hypothetical protein
VTTTFIDTGTEILNAAHIVSLKRKTDTLTEITTIDGRTIEMKESLPIVHAAIAPVVPEHRAFQALLYCDCCGKVARQAVIGWKVIDNHEVLPVTPAGIAYPVAGTAVEYPDGRVQDDTGSIFESATDWLADWLKQPDAEEREDVALAEQLKDYMDFRAKHEDTVCEFDAGFFLKHLKTGIRDFFGVKVADGELVLDDQNPEAFEEWKGGSRPTLQ